MKIGNNIHYLCGTYGSNIGIIKGDSEIAFVEGGWSAETAGLALEYMEEIKGAASLKYLFMTHADRAFSRSQLLDQVWGDQVYVEERTVDVHIRRLRKALEPSGHDRLLQTVRGVGYRFSDKI